MKIKVFVVFERLLYKGSILDDTDLEIGQRLRTARNNSKKTQSELADLLKVTDSTFSKYERGALSITPERINNLCKILKMHHQWLLTGLGEMYKEQGKNHYDVSAKLAQLPRETEKAIRALIDTLIAKDRD